MQWRTWLIEDPRARGAQGQQSACGSHAVEVLDDKELPATKSGRLNDEVRIHCSVIVEVATYATRWGRPVRDALQPPFHRRGISQRLVIDVLETLP